MAQDSTFYRKVPRSFLGPVWHFCHCFAAGLQSPGLTFCEAFELIWSSWAQFWIIPFTFPLLQLKILRIYSAVSGIFEVKVTKYQKAQQKLWKSSELICVSLLSSYEAPKLIFDHLCLFVSYFHCSVEILRVKMSLLTEGSRESLSSLFDLLFSSFPLIWFQKAQAKGLGL